MGRRARAAGLTNAILRETRARQRTRDEEAHQLASAVYQEAVAWKADGGALNMAPVAVSASLAAAGLARSWGLSLDDVPDIAAYLCAGFLRLVGDANVEGFEEWRTEVRSVRP